MRHNVKVIRRRRVRPILQTCEADCGAACLAMILDYFGSAARLSDCRERCGGGRDGVTARAIAQAAQSFGLRARAFSVDPPAMRHVKLPAIIHWESDHFAVVERWSPRGVDIVDPAMGAYRLTTAEFDAGFTRLAMTFEPDARFERRRGARPSSWRAYLPVLWSLPGVRGALVQILGASLVLQVSALALPLFTQALVDHVLPSSAASNLLPILGAGLLIWVLAEAVANYLRSSLLIYLQGRLDAQMMLGFFEHMLTLPFRFFEQRASGDLLMRLGSNAVIRAMLTSQTLSMLLDGALVFTQLIILLAFDRVLGGVVFGLGVVQVALLWFTLRRVYGLTQRHLAAEAASQSYVVEAIVGIATLKASGGEARALERFSGLFFKQLHLSLKLSHLEALVETALGGLGTLAPLLLLWVGATRVLAGAMSLGTMLALNALAALFLAPLASFVSNGQRLQLVGAYLERIADVLEAEPEQDPERVQAPAGRVGRIELDHVSFRYEPQAPPVLWDISLTIAPGQKIALVGRTGAGKSTLARLLLGLYLPSEGEILYDGVPLHRLNWRTLRSQFGVVLQEPLLFSGSIRQNIAFGNPDLPMESVVEAAEQAAIHEEILRMPNAYETRLAEGGLGLSGGQRQRLALARALAHRPAVLLLDEATSHLDTVTERRIDENLSRLPVTRIVIAHRISTIDNADQNPGAIGRTDHRTRFIRGAGGRGGMVRLAREDPAPARGARRYVSGVAQRRRRGHRAHRFGRAAGTFGAAGAVSARGRPDLSARSSRRRRGSSRR
ncbi:MAG: peptidase domain-containing ABC transporter [Minicystis sp.]